MHRILVSKVAHTCLAIQQLIRIILLLNRKEHIVVHTEGEILLANLVWFCETLKENLISPLGCSESLRAVRCGRMIGNAYGWKRSLTVGIKQGETVGGREIYGDPAW